MSLRKLLLALLLVFSCDVVFAATFTVTSNADSGPGTLRQALLDAAANGTSTVDNIIFNLPGYTNVANVTITLKTKLPAVTGNVIIDGTTQPGPALGISSAKIIITPATPAAGFDAFNVSVLVAPTDAVEFYGLYLKDFSPNQQGFGDGIVTFGDCKLVIGAAGKGNVISGDWFALFGYFGNAKIQGNFFGLDTDGLTAKPNFTILYSNYDYNNLLIGGPNTADGNIIVGGYAEGISLYGINNKPQSVTVTNNSFGTNYNASAAIQTGYNGFLQSKDPGIQLYCDQNVFAANNLAINILTSGLLRVTGNYFGTDKTQKYQLGTGDEAIHIVTNVNAVIGGDAASAQNVFANYMNPIFADNDSNMEVIKNTFYCNDHVSLGNLVGNSYVDITDLEDNSISGDAAPGARIQLYYTTSPSCPNCNPTTWFTDVFADANGRWVYNGDTRQDILASSTITGNTFGFQRFLVLPPDVTIVDFDCHHPGSIKVNKNRTGRIQFIWRDNSNGKIVGTGREIDNLPGGVYNLEINEGTSCLTLASGQFTVNDLRPRTLPQTFQLDCDNPTASFTAAYTTAPQFTVVKYVWEDAQGNLISTIGDVKGLAAGNYYLYITDSNGCSSSKALYQVIAPVEAPVIDDSKAVVTDANCDHDDGSITGMSISNTGNSIYGWRSADGTQVTFGTTEMTNAPAGQYYFAAEYNANCPLVKSRLFTINSINGIKIDDSAIKITPSTCGNENGSIKGIVVTGATNYNWFNSSNASVSQSPDLINQPTGFYYLVASNSSCNIKSAVYTIADVPGNKNYTSNYLSTNATCGQNNGGISVIFAGNAPKSYRWANAAGNTLVSNAALTSVAAGNYLLFVTDENGCESLYNTYTINTISPVQIVSGSEQITNDQCSEGVGSIAGINVTGGILPYAYNWVNSAQQSIGSSLNLTGLVAGVYTLQVKDSTSCATVTQDYTIPDETATIDPPQVDNLQVCGPGDALLSVKSPQKGYGYRLYTSSTGGTVIDDEASGVFKIVVKGTGSYFISQYIGDCESTRTQVNISVGLSAVDIPNTITPNNDGINDIWTLNGLANYPNALVQVFDRYGQKVFESKGYSHPFDGRMNGAILPPGVYYYIIKLNTNCNLLSGSLTIVR